MNFHDLYVGSVVTKFALGSVAIVVAKLLSVIAMKRFPASPNAVVGIYVVTTFVVVSIFVRVL
jgi:hypothetical protein